LESRASTVVATEGALEFGASDLVYGPSARGALRGLADKTGGRLLTDIPKPANVGWVEHSLNTLKSHIGSGGQVRFDLTHAQDVAGMLRGTGQFASTVTAQELRFIQSNWSTFRNNVSFYLNGAKVAAPW
jgi:hypothetical protein